MADIFFSYKREDRAGVEPLVRMLEAEGFSVWWDPAIVPGERFAKVIRNALDDASCVVVGWSVHSIESDWVQDEAATGRDRGMLVPVSLDGAAPPLGFRQLQTQSLKGWSGDRSDPRIASLIAGVRRLVGDPPATPQTPPSNFADRDSVEKAHQAARIEDERVAWEAIRKSRSAADFQQFLTLFANGQHAEAARARLAQLRNAKPLGRPANFRRSLIFGGAAALVAIVGILAALFSERLGALSEHFAAAPPESVLTPGQKFRDCKSCPEMVVIPAGSFTMGSPDVPQAYEQTQAKPAHEVTVVQPFAVGRFEVTRGEYAVFERETATDRSRAGSCAIEKNPPEWKMRFVTDGYSWRNPGFAQTDMHPAVCIGWHSAKAYVEWLSKKTGKGYRLLTEAEWEYVARAGTTTKFPWGNNANDLCANGNGVDRTITKTFAPDTFANCDDRYIYTAPVGSFKANDFGLHDLLGNASEWVEDCHHWDYAAKPATLNATGRAWTTDCAAWKVVRGGSWRWNVPAAGRGGDSGEYPNNDGGLRVARTL